MSGAAMLDAPPWQTASLPSGPTEIEWANWASRSLIISKVVEPAKIEPIQEAQAFSGGATEMVPRLADRGGWELEFRMRAMQHVRARALQLTQVLISQVGHDLLPSEIDTQVVVRVLAELAKSRGVREISRGRRFDPDTVRTALLALSEWVEKESRVPDPPPTVAMSESKSSSLALAIEAMLERTPIEPEHKEVARTAVSEGAAIARREFPDARPYIALTEEGILTLQWQSPGKGLMLVFTGDGTATYSIKELGGWYTTDAREFALDSGLPSEVRTAIREIEGA